MNVFTSFNRFAAVTPSDTVDFLIPPTAIWVGGAGIVVAVMADNTTVNFTCVAGSLLPITVRRINSTSTTATLLVALYRA